MARKVSLKRNLYRQFDFDFDFSCVANEWSISNIMEAIYLGQPFYDTCFYLNFDGESMEDLIKEHVLYTLCEEAKQLTARQVELLEQYADQTILGMSFGEIFSELMYADPQEWFHTFENSIIYLNDNSFGEVGIASSSTLSETERVRVMNRLFGQIPYDFDDVENYDEYPIQIMKQAWYVKANKSGAAFRFFTAYLTQEQLLSPHPIDILSNKRIPKMLKQYEHYKAILKELSSNQDVTADMLLYENELHIGFLCYASSKIEETGIYSDLSNKRKADTIVKLTALLTLVKNPELRIMLFDTLLNVQNAPFNFEENNDLEEAAMEHMDLKSQVWMLDSVKEGQVALYLSLICTIEVTLKLFVKDKLQEMISYFEHIGVEELSAEEQEDAPELLQLKKQLVLYVLMQNHRQYTKETLETAEIFQAKREVNASDKIFATLYNWTYKINKDFEKGELFPHTWRAWLRQNDYRLILPVTEIIDSYRLFADEFKEYAHIKPEDLGNLDVEKLLKRL